MVFLFLDIMLILREIPPPGFQKHLYKKFSQKCWKKLSWDFQVQEIRILYKIWLIKSRMFSVKKTIFYFRRSVRKCDKKSFKKFLVDLFSICFYIFCWREFFEIFFLISSKQTIFLKFRDDYFSIFQASPSWNNWILLGFTTNYKKILSSSKSSNRQIPNLKRQSKIWPELCPRNLHMAPIY